MESTHGINNDYVNSDEDYQEGYTHSKNQGRRRKEGGDREGKREERWKDSEKWGRCENTGIKIMTRERGRRIGF